MQNHETERTKVKDSQPSEIDLLSARLEFYPKTSVDPISGVPVLDNYKIIGTSQGNTTNQMKLLHF